MADATLPATPRQKALRALAGAYRVEMAPEGQRAYWEALNEIPDAKLIAGIARALKECPTFPSAATLREQCRLAQPATEAAALLPAPRDDERDPRNWHRCPACQDSGWLVRQGPHTLKPEWIIDYAYRCPCWQTNPAIRSGVGAR